MSINPSFTFIFLCLIPTSYLIAKPDFIIYSSPLSLTLLQEGAYSFINSSKTQPEEEYKQALYDVINMASFNQTDVPKLLKNIHDSLNDKIKSIEELPEEITTDYKTVALGLGIIGIGLGLSYVVYKSSDNSYNTNQQESQSIRTLLENKGIKIEPRGNKIHFTLPSAHVYDEIGKQCDRIVELANEEVSLAGRKLCAATLGPLGSLLYGTGTIRIGLDPHADDKHLEKYKKMRETIKELQKKDSSNYRNLLSKN